MSGQKKVLILGAGLVTPPLIRYLSEHNFHVIVANRTLGNAQKIVNGLANTEAVELDVEKESDLEKLESLVPQVDAVVSMLPYLFHTVVAKSAIKHKKHFFTTSYVSDAMRELAPQAKANGTIMLNECGVDPGTDHMSAMRIIDQVRANGGKIEGFSSFCGGLPAPDSNDNPFGYKLSWAPRGVLLASKNDAHYLKDGKDVNIPGKVLFENFEVIDFPGVGKLESYPNRNSTQYIDIYGIKETKSIIRGTYRYPGWCPTIKKIADIGFLSIEPENFAGKTFAEVTKEKVKCSDSDLKAKVAEFIGLKSEDKIISNMEWLGLFSGEKIPSNIKTPLDALCHLCKEKLVYKPGERDMLVMKHDFDVVYPDRREHIVCTLLDYGIKNGDSSMSRTVSLPVAIAIRLVLEGKITLTGLQIPTIPELYNPILDELESLGIKFNHWVAK